MSTDEDRNRNVHSIANISDAIRSHIRRDSLTGPLRLHRGHNTNRANFPLNNEDFENISNAVVHLFQMKKLQENELSSLQENVRNLVTTDAGPLIYDYYKDKLMKKGMVILREKIKHETGMVLLTKLGEQWDYFYREILPSLQALLYPVKILIFFCYILARSIQSISRTKQMSIRQVTLLEFRNVVLLKLPVEEALRDLADDPTDLPPATQQMLLVLHSIHEVPCTENYIQLEKLVARVIRPYLGRLGIYNGGSEPEIRSNFKMPVRVPVVIEPRHPSNSEESLSQADSRTKRHSLSPLVLPQHRGPNKRSPGLLRHSLLQSVQEQDRGQIRRYSIATS